MSGVVIEGGLVFGGDGLPTVRTVAFEGARVVTAAPPGARRLDATGCWVFPGFIDLRARLRDGADARAACAAGFTTVLQAPEASVSPAGGPRLLRAVPLTRDLDGEELGELPPGTTVASQGSRPLPRAGVLRRALQYAGALDVLVMVHAEDPSLAGKGVLGEGLEATRLGLPGVPVSAESSVVARDLEIQRETGARLHFSHLTCGRSLELVGAARQRGARVSCDVAAHHLALDVSAAQGYSLTARVWPALRERPDVDAVGAAVSAGLVDAVTSDHCRVDPIDREHPFEDCVPGRDAYPGFLAGLRRLGFDGPALARLLGAGPARLLGLPWHLEPGAPADVTIFDPGANAVVATFVDGLPRHGNEASP